MSLESKGKKLILGDGIRHRFPIFSSGRERLAYLDSAASSQKPREVIDRITNYLSFEHANIHRGAYHLSATATENYDSARRSVAKFIQAADENSIVFTKNSTEAVNLVARSIENSFSPGDVILLTLLEHHSNIVPWQLLAQRKKLKIEWVNINADASIDLVDFKAKISKFKPKLVSMTAVSNAFGSVLPLQEIIACCRDQGSLIFVDASQLVMHSEVSVTKLDVDFLCFTAHKMYGPTGLGVLYVLPRNYAIMEPFLGGGDMIETVTVEGSTWAEPPRKFEAGTPAIAEAIAMGTAIEFLEEIGVNNVKLHETAIFERGWDMLARESGVQLYGPRTLGGAQSSIIAFNVVGVHPHDMATVADQLNVQLRAGHHCAQPALSALGLQSTTRASVAMYSDVGDFEALIEAIRLARKTFS